MGKISRVIDISSFTDKTFTGLDYANNMADA
jgi:hypothetical protein